MADKKPIGIEEGWAIMQVNAGDLLCFVQTLI